MEPWICNSLLSFRWNVSCRKQEDHRREDPVMYKTVGINMLGMYAKNAIDNICPLDVNVEMVYLSEDDIPVEVSSILKQIQGEN
jgi:hypothetical protein